MSHEPEPMETDAAVGLTELPIECQVEILSYLSAAELLATSCTCRALADACAADVLWRGLCVRGKHGHVLDFKESLGCFHHPDAKPLTVVSSSTPPAQMPTTPAVRCM